MNTTIVSWNEFEGLIAESAYETDDPDFTLFEYVALAERWAEHRNYVRRVSSEAKTH